MGETERLTSIPYTNPVGSDHMGVLLDITLNHCGHSSNTNYNSYPNPVLSYAKWLTLYHHVARQLQQVKVATYISTS